MLTTTKATTTAVDLPRVRVPYEARLAALGARSESRASATASTGGRPFVRVHGEHARRGRFSLREAVFCVAMCLLVPFFLGALVLGPILFGVLDGDADVPAAVPGPPVVEPGTGATQICVA